MTRTITFEQPNDTCLFTPLQLQPVAAFRFGMTSWASWLSKYVASFPSLVRDHELGAVVVGAYVTWFERCGFFDCDGLRIVGDVTVIQKRALFREHHLIHAVGGKLDGKPIAEGIGIMRPLHVAKEAGLGATPIPVPPELASKFEADELTDDIAAPRPVPAMVKQLADATPLAEGEVRAFCSRALSEVADQWSFVEVPSFAAHGREKLVLEAGAQAADLRRGLKKPLREIQVEYGRPAFAFDELVVRTRAYAVDADLVFTHAITSASDGKPRATIVERF